MINLHYGTSDYQIILGNYNVEAFVHIVQQKICIHIFPVLLFIPTDS